MGDLRLKHRCQVIGNHPANKFAGGFLFKGLLHLSTSGPTGTRSRSTAFHVRLFFNNSARGSTVTTVWPKRRIVRAQKLPSWAGESRPPRPAAGCEGTLIRKKNITSRAYISSSNPSALKWMPDVVEAL
jgi:hypothetical protein